MEQAGHVEDEFACPRRLWGKLQCVWPLVERIFGVRLELEAGGAMVAREGQIWLKMKGRKREVEEAKVFVKGQVNEAEQQNMSYPQVLHSVFCGAGGLFLDCLMKYTCAFVQVGPPGALIISGLEEPVVRACSFILDLVEKCECTQGWRTKTRAWVAGESQDSRQAFMSLAEKREDEHTVELLALPAAVKEALLSLVKESGLYPAEQPKQGSAVKEGEWEREWEVEKEVERDGEREEEREVEWDGKREEEREVERDGERRVERAGEREEEREVEWDGERWVEREEEREVEWDGERRVERAGEREEEREVEWDGERRVERDGEREVEWDGERRVERDGERQGFLVGQNAKQVWQRDEKIPEHSEQLKGRERRRRRGAHTHTPSPNQLASPHAPSPPKTSPHPVRGPPGHAYPPAQPTAADGPEQCSPATIVTGEQRFLEGLLTPFRLNLSDGPGNPNLRQVIIDGSNVAMSHGLGQFFSCRGIALAVQYFWSRGHRRVVTFVPRWRQKKDPRVKEQQYLSELQNLGCLSFTPSREVQGKMINSYDDRFMLQLAQQTDGVIVTNDNLRDLLDESPAFSSIIRHRLLQYTFVGDHFMVPDDPLGRGGPHLKDFLHRSPASAAHTFAGLAPPLTSAPQMPHRLAAMEVLQYHHQPVGAAGGQWQPADPAALREHLLHMFPGQDSLVTLALQCNPDNDDIASLSHIIQNLQREREAER